MMSRRVQLITYVDRLGGDFRGLKTLLDGTLHGLFDGVHVLPFFQPIDGADAGFDPSDHRAVDQRLGGWREVRVLAADYSLMADLIVNHMSVESPQFAEIMAKGRESAYWPLFLKKRDVFSESAQTAEFAQIYRPRSGQPFTRIQLRDGEEQEFWTTFSSGQLDINVESTAGRSYLESILDIFAAAGISGVRLDAAGYAIKRSGTNCFMLPATFDFIRWLSDSAASRGMETLVEVHSHFQTQIDIASHVGRVYDFALPPLVLHSVYTENARALKRWLAIAPRNCVTVLDTHDGIGILDVARERDRAGLLEDDEVEALVEMIHERTNNESRAASGQAAANLDVYQVNATIYDALGRSDSAYLTARAIQFFAPGTPQVYYVGLLAGGNDMQLMRTTGVGRDINRHYYTSEEIEQAVARPVVQSLIKLIRLRNTSPAFAGQFSMPECADHQLRLRWQSSSAWIELRVDLRSRTASIVETVGDSTAQYAIGEEVSQVA
jgi:sucrose phosphorylase